MLFNNNDIILIAEKDKIRFNDFICHFKYVIYGPQKMHKDDKSIREELFFLVFCFIVCIKILIINPKVIVLLSADPVIKTLKKFRVIGCFSKTRFVLISRRTMLFNNKKFINAQLTAKDSIILHHFVGFVKNIEHLLPLGKETKYSFVPFEPGSFSGKPNYNIAENGSYIFSGGDKSRDYAILLKAIDDCSVKLRIFTSLPIAHLTLNNPSTNCELYPLPEYSCSPADYYQEKSLSMFLTHMANALFVVVPLLQSNELRGLTIALQALRLGKALVITQTPGIETYIQNGYNGILVPPGSSGILNQSINMLIHNELKRNELAANALETSKLFSKENIDLKLLDICKKEIERQKSL